MPSTDQLILFWDGKLTCDRPFVTVYRRCILHVFIEATSRTGAVLSVRIYFFLTEGDIEVQEDGHLPKKFNTVFFSE